MILLDTDHVSVLTESRHSMRAPLAAKLERAGDSLAIPIVSAEEQLRGWLAKIHKTRKVHDQIVPYLRLANLIDFLSDWQIIYWNEPAADAFTSLRASRVRIGTQDLKIAAITLVNDALLLSANLRDFEQVPGLRVENWLSG
jgi:tRNA(fMet)-specific endonuclease VapC